MSNSDPTQLLQLVRLKLLSLPAITSLVADRIHTSHFMDFDNQTRELPCIIIELVGGDVSYSSKFQSVSMYIYGYSNNNSAEALEVYHQSFIALHAQRIANSSLDLTGLIEETSRPTTGYNDKVRSWYARGTFLALTVG